jgi:hypothetical protein
MSHGHAGGEAVSKRARHVTGHRVNDRWMAEITYVTDRPMQLAVFEEIEDLDEIIERGPDWNEIEEIKITLNRPTALATKEPTDDDR